MGDIEKKLNFQTYKKISNGGKMANREKGKW